MCVSSSLVDVGATMGTANLVALGIIALVWEEAFVPITALTLSFDIKFAATVADSALSDLLSFLLTSIFLPFMPPEAFSSATAMSAPRSLPLPYAARAPVISISYPILNVLPIALPLALLAAPGGAQEASVMTAAAVITPTKTLDIFFMVFS